MNRGLCRCITAVWLAALALSSPAVANARPEAASGQASQGLMRQSAAQFWQVVTAKPEDRLALLQRYFSPGMRERNGDAGLLETFATLAEVLGSDMASSRPTEVLGGPREGELHYTLSDGRRVSLKITLAGDAAPLIEKFAVRPLPPKVTAVKPAQLPAAIDARIKAESRAGRFSGAVLVARGDELIHARAAGMADRQAGRANLIDTPFNLGSINKMFTAIAIAQLQAAGKLDWQDRVGRHLPDFPNAKIRDQVTIHQLLTHTSGVGSYWNEAHAARRHELDTQLGFLQTFVDQPLLFEPGAGLEYSNGGPVILGLIIEAISGMDYYSYIRKHIYEPAGMRWADHFRRDDRSAKFALGYMKTDAGSWQDNSQTLSLRGSAAGGGYASVRDLHAFARALKQERLLTRPQLETLWEARGQTGPIGYGYLFSVGGTPARRWVGHNGGAPGISAEFLFYPDDGLVIAVLANQDHAATAMREWLSALVEASLPARR
ncbi:MAG: serine hydrolase domain-containing protein [Roseateles sp.]|uniref:serine hydrolase domain-containing protein n=1 Tax=Roseateles sp. TaxID=1971397 RepID=UPI00403614AD